MSSRNTTTGAAADRQQQNPAGTVGAAVSSDNSATRRRRSPRTPKRKRCFDEEEQQQQQQQQDNDDEQDEEVGMKSPAASKAPRQQNRRRRTKQGGGDDDAEASHSNVDSGSSKKMKNASTTPAKKKQKTNNSAKKKKARKTPPSYRRRDETKLKQTPKAIADRERLRRKKAIERQQILVQQQTDEMQRQLAQERQRQQQQHQQQRTSSGMRLLHRAPWDAFTSVKKAKKKRRTSSRSKAAITSSRNTRTEQQEHQQQQQQQEIHSQALRTYLTAPLTKYIPMPRVDALVGWTTNVVDGGSSNSERQRQPPPLHHNPLLGLVNTPLPPSIVWGYLRDTVMTPGKVPASAVATTSQQQQQQQQPRQQQHDFDFDTSAWVSIGAMVEEMITATLLPLARQHVTRCRQLEQYVDCRNSKGRRRGGRQKKAAPKAAAAAARPSSANDRDNDNPFVQWTLPPEEAISQLRLQNNDKRGLLVTAAPLTRTIATAASRRQTSTTIVIDDDSSKMSTDDDNSISKDNEGKEQQQHEEEEQEQDVVVRQWCFSRGFDVDYVKKNMDVFGMFLPPAPIPPQKMIPGGGAMMGDGKETETANHWNLKTVLSISNEWVLEELVPGDDGVARAIQSSQVFHTQREDASRCYWMMRGDDGQDANALIVQKDEVPSDQFRSITQCFRLSRLNGAKEQSGENKGTGISSTLLLDEKDATDAVGTKLLYRDTSVKIWEFRLAPEARCDFHRHRHTYFFLNLTESLTQALDSHGKPAVIDGNSNELAAANRQTKGQCTFVTKDQLSAHAVRNVGTETFLQFVVEFLD